MYALRPAWQLRIDLALDLVRRVKADQSEKTGVFGGGRGLKRQKVKLGSEGNYSVLGVLKHVNLH